VHHSSSVAAGLASAQLMVGGLYKLNPVDPPINPKP
jgi:hypothetical protein